MGDIPILGGPKQPSERQRLALLRGLTGRKVADEDQGLILPPGYGPKKSNKRSSKSRKKKTKRR